MKAAADCGRLRAWRTIRAWDRRNVRYVALLKPSTKLEAQSRRFRSRRVKAIEEVVAEAMNLSHRDTSSNRPQLRINDHSVYVRQRVNPRLIFAAT